MPDSVTITCTGTKDDPAPLNLDGIDTACATIVQALVDLGFPRSGVTIQSSGHDDLTGPERTGDDYDEV